jgi:predicted phage terminase large subunit-like protein
VTFIAAKLTDNKALTTADPGYMSNLLALPLVERERLLTGNWKIRASAGLLFKREWVTVIDVAPADLEIVRGWDFAATPKTASNDPDSTSSTKIGRTRGGRYIVLDNTNITAGPAGVEAHLRNVASQDGVAVTQSMPQDPGAAGKSQAAAYIKALAGYNGRSSPETGGKVTRFNPFSAQAEAGNVDVLRGPWNEAWFCALEGFPPPMPGKGHDDDADSTARAFNTLAAPLDPSAGYLELWRRQLAAREAERDEIHEVYLAPGSMAYQAEQAVIARANAIEDAKRWDADVARSVKFADDYATSTRLYAAVARARHQHVLGAAKRKLPEGHTWSRGCMEGLEEQGELDAIADAEKAFKDAEQMLAAKVAAYDAAVEARLGEPDLSPT